MSPALAAAPRVRFLADLGQAYEAGTLVKLVLAKPTDRGGDLLRVTGRRLALKSGEGWSFVDSHRTRDVTRNLGFAEGLAEVDALLGRSFAHAHLTTTAEEIELRASRKGRYGLTRRQVAAGARPPAPLAHDRVKRRWIDVSRPYLAELGVTDASGRLIPAMARKWKQINKFVEVFDRAWSASRLADGRQARVLDFGSGKGYLTFALHDHLRESLGISAEVTGVELRRDLVELCNRAVADCRLEGLRFVQGDVRTQAPETVDVMIALHACDTATDHALHAGLRAGAGIIMCSPCCHKQLRPQMRSPGLLQPMLQHGIHLGQQAEMVTDSLRALLLEAEGYATQVFEFVALEHTSKNKMILAVRRDRPVDRAAILAQVAEIKAFYGIREHCLESLLGRAAVTA